MSQVSWQAIAGIMCFLVALTIANRSSLASAASTMRKWFSGKRDGDAAIILGLIGGALMIWAYWPDNAHTPRRTDVLDQSYEADRPLRVDLLRRMQAKTFDNNEQKAEWHTAESRAIINKAFRPYLDAVAEAIVDDTIPQLADELER